MMYIPIEKESIPYSFEIEIDEEVIVFEVLYNERFDFFTLDAYMNDEPIIFGEKLTLDNEAFTVIDYLEIIPSQLIPTDPTGLEKRITFENMNEQVFLQVIDDE